MKGTAPLVAMSTVLSFLGGCGKTWQAASFPDQSLRVQTAGKSRIYLICDTVLGLAISDKIMDGKTFVGTVGPGSYLCWEREPGSTTILVNKSTEKTGQLLYSCRLEVALEAGQVYYLQLHRWPGPIYSLERVAEAKGRNLLKSCKPARNVKLTRAAR